MDCPVFDRQFAYQCGMVDDADGGLALLEARNSLAHTYSDEQSLSVIRKLKTDFIVLFEALKEQIDENWMDGRIFETFV